jgi:hypothetical protein
MEAILLDTNPYRDSLGNQPPKIGRKKATKGGNELAAICRNGS